MIRRIVVALAACAIGSVAVAQECVGARRIVVGFQAGGAADQIARMLAERLSKRFATPFIVENKTGAAGNIAAEYVAKSAADGCTLLLTGNNHNLNAFIYQRAGYEPLKNFDSVARIVEAPSLLTVNPGQHIKTIGQLVAFAKANPGKLSYGTSGLGSVNHIGMELLAQAAGIQLVHVPYKGASSALQDTVSGIVPLNNGSVAASLPYVDAGRLVALAVGGSNRTHAMPQVPTIGEAGYPDATFTVWVGLLAPAGMPSTLQERLNAEVRTILSDQPFRDGLAIKGLEPAPSTASEFAAFLVNDYKRSRAIVRDLKLKAD